MDDSRGSYKLDTLDEVEIEFILDPELNRKVVIRPDGMITLPGIGDVRAVGLAPENSRERSKRGSDKRTSSETATQTEIPQLQNGDGISEPVLPKGPEAGRFTHHVDFGQQTQVTIKPDGTIDLPLLKDRILAAGYTVSDVERTVNKLYRRGELKHVVASMALNTAKSRQVYILGEVTTAGGMISDSPLPRSRQLLSLEARNTTRPISPA